MSGRRRNAAGDSRRLLAAAGELAECRNPSDLATPLKSLRALVGADTVSAGELRVGQRSGSMDIVPQLAFPDLFDEESLSYWAAHWRDHPSLARQLSGVEPRPLRLGDFLGWRQFQRLGIYPAYRRLGLRGEMSLQIHWEPGRIACVSVHRAEREFGERERSLLALLSPHLQAARARIELSADARRQRRLLEGAVEADGAAPILVGRDGSIAAASPAAMALLGRWFQPPRLATQLPPELVAWLAARTRDGDPTPLRLTAEEKELEVAASPDEGGCLLLLRERRFGPPDSAALEAALPLTPRQAEVLALVSRGLGDAAIAVELGISVRTVGHHVRHILARLQVSSRTAAAALACRVD